MTNTIIRRTYTQITIPLVITITKIKEIRMGCCNQPPNGGSNNIGLLLKVIAVLFAVIMLLAFLFN